MKVLVTGGTGVIGAATVTELIGRGHQVRLLTRCAEATHKAWERSVEPHPGDVGDASSVHGAADGCAAVIHITGAIEESPPEVTFERINVGGTVNIVREAERAGVRRLVFVSSLGADRGSTAYHRSKVRGEDIVRNSSLSWTIVRVGAVMGAGDRTVSVLLRMVRTLPAVPVIGSGNQPFQPVWHEDVGWALSECLERDDLAGELLRIAGPDVITVRDALDLFGQVTDRSFVHVRLPVVAVKLGSALASAVGIATPVSAATVQLLVEGSFLRDGEANDLTGRLGMRPVPTRDRLVQLVDELPEQMPDDGVGGLKRRRFRIDISGTEWSAHELLERFRDRFAELVPFDAVAEPGAARRLEPNATLTMSLPARGHVQVRVAAIDEHSVAVATIEGHPLAGIVRFRFDDLPDRGVRFTIDVLERPASRLDQLSMLLMGSAIQTRVWRKVAVNVAQDAGGVSPEGVAEQSWDLGDEEAEPLEDWIRDLVQARHRRTENRAWRLETGSQAGS